MSIQLESTALANTQQMEVAVNGPDGATYLVLCTGIANFTSVSSESFTFLVGPQLSRRQFVGAIASGALSTIRSDDRHPIEANLISIDANYDDESGQVKVTAEVLASIPMTKLAISYNVNILAELPI